jgi:PhoPQ-activated pathogenicity-related protein
MKKSKNNSTGFARLNGAATARAIKGLLSGLILLAALITTSHAEETVLAQYVKAPDSAFEYQLVNTTYAPFYTTYIIDLTSQQWHAADVRPRKWKHWLVIVEPRLLGEYTEYLPFFSLVRTDKALLYIIRGDADHEDQPAAASPQAVQLALRTRSIVAELHGIPIGPVAFLDEQPDTNWWDDLNPFDNDDDKVLRIEDSLQARSFDLALSTGDLTWALMAPMTKAVVRGMDVIQEFLQQRYLGRRVARGFVVTGHSKRGHVAWLAAALDERVTGVVPISYDLLNLEAQIALQEASWPERSPEQDINEEFDLYNRFKSTTGYALIANIDPYAYLDQLNIPALVMVGSSDNYSCSDSANLYLNDLPGDAHVFYAANQGHAINELPEVNNTLTAFYQHLIKNKPMPKFTWSGLAEGTFTVTPVTQKPVAVKLWTATNPAARDFREISEIPWSATALEENVQSAYTGVVEKPSAGGYTAFYVELTYQDGERGTPAYSLATPITVLGN